MKRILDTRNTQIQMLDFEKDHDHQFLQHQYGQYLYQMTPNQVLGMHNLKSHNEFDQKASYEKKLRSVG